MLSVQLLTYRTSNNSKARKLNSSQRLPISLESSGKRNSNLRKKIHKRKEKEDSEKRDYYDNNRANCNSHRFRINSTDSEMRTEIESTNITNVNTTAKKIAQKRKESESIQNIINNEDNTSDIEVIQSDEVNNSSSQDVEMKETTDSNKEDIMRDIIEKLWNITECKNNYRITGFFKEWFEQMVTFWKTDKVFLLGVIYNC